MSASLTAPGTLPGGTLTALLESLFTASFRGIEFHMLDADHEVIGNPSVDSTPSAVCSMVSTLVALRSPQDPEPLIAVGRVHGEIARAPVGGNGFGFDPVMWIPEFGKTFAQLPTEVKNANSHRGRAAQQMVELIRGHWA